jgi:hypothetical protein
VVSLVLQIGKEPTIRHPALLRAPSIRQNVLKPLPIYVSIESEDFAQQESIPATMPSAQAQFGYGAPFLVMRIQWSVKAWCMPGISTLGIWQRMQSGLLTLQTSVGWFFSPFLPALFEWHRTQTGS